MSSDWTLVTGANGFLGARLVRKLVQRGEKVKAFVRAGSDLRELQDLPSERVRIAVGNVRICDRVYAALSSCDRLYHVAATYSVNERRREEIIRDAAQGTEATLEAARRAGITRIVITSSAATLGASTKPDLLDETTSFNVNAPNCYTKAKVEAEQIALRRAQEGQPIIIVNPTMIVGPGDFRPTPTGRQIVRYLGFSPSFRIPTPPGGFSYVDVDDAAEGHILAMEKGKVGERYILGGENLTHREFFQTLADVSGLAEPGEEFSRGRLRLLARAAQWYAAWNDTEPLVTPQLVENYFDRFVFVGSEKAKNELGFSPRPARESLARACRWYLDHGYVSKRAARRA